MTLKLRRKLQTTIQRITADPLEFFGRQEVCRSTFFFSAVLAAAVAGAETRFVRPVTYQQNLSEMGNVPVMRIDSVSEDAENVQLVSYAEPLSDSEKNVLKERSETVSSKPLKWVAVNSPEARRIQENSRGGDKVFTADSALERGVKPVSVQMNGPALVTPIPSVMPRYSRVRLTSGSEELDGLDLNNLDSLDVSGNEESPAVPAEESPAVLPEMEKPLDMENSVEIVPDGADDPMVSGGGSADLSPALPAAESTENEMSDLLEAPVVDPGKSVEIGEEPSESAVPGAIGNKKQESKLKQGGLNQNTQMPNSGMEVQNQLPKAAPLSELTQQHRELTESFTTRQVDIEDYDMPCESSEPMHRITEITNDIELHDTKIVPKSCPLAPEGELFPAREFAGTNFTWTASNLCHNPLYFEQPALERYGHTIGPLQPVLSGAQFLATIPYMPMLMAIDPPNECQYALGYHRPGSCAPRKWNPIPYSMRGAIVEGGVATALVFLIP
ncbi:MAG: hypothetical protein Q4D17_07240 [Planctomycetia bacterium]|nr:hypothetical protein [Planctomycetia bacterium]